MSEPTTKNGYLTCEACGATSIEERLVAACGDRDKYERSNPIGTRGGYVRFHLHCVVCGSDMDLVVANHRARNGSQLSTTARHPRTCCTATNAPSPTHLSPAATVWRFKP